MFIKSLFVWQKFSLCLFHVDATCWWKMFPWKLWKNIFHQNSLGKFFCWFFFIPYTTNFHHLTCFYFIPEYECFICPRDGFGKEKMNVNEGFYMKIRENLFTKVPFTFSLKEISLFQFYSFQLHCTEFFIIFQHQKREKEEMEKRIWNTSRKVPKRWNESKGWKHY